MRKSLKGARGADACRRSPSGALDAATLLHGLHKNLPSVDQVVRGLQHLRLPPQLVTSEVRLVLDEIRESLLARREVPDLPVEPAMEPIEQAVERRLLALLSPSLRRVINATGVILHTNLGRAPLGDFNPIARYSNLEYDLETGKRGKRDVHTARLLERLIGRPGIIVNNNAAAVYLVLNELAAGREAIVSRGELIEIGDGFRIPEIMVRSGAILREVGTTNRTRIEDYANAVNDRTALILRVHPSNFHVSGFTSRPGLEGLCQLGRERGVPVYEDLGSGCLVDLRSQGIDEPLAGDSLAAGVNLVSFSCDKLLGGPQSGIIAGDGEVVQRIRRNQMYRAFRPDKLIVEALENTLRLLLVQNWKAIPALEMILCETLAVRARAERVGAALSGIDVKIREAESPIGGGSTPDRTLPTWVVEVAVANPVQVERRLRASQIPVIARIERDKIIFDMRTVADEEEQPLTDAILAAAC